MSRYVVSLGGNALGNNPEEQKELLKQVAQAIFPLIQEGHDLVIVHGNGPQVGMINLAFTESKSTPVMPFAECGAMSQGYIGYHIQNALTNLINKNELKKSVTTLVTQVLVDPKDTAFQHPTKPIGSFYSKEEADSIIATYHYTMVEDAGRGYRRVVPSPKPMDIIEKETILTLLDAHQVVVASGGGGIPVILQDGQLFGVDAVIDKDYASAKMAELIDADALVILTAVEHVYVDFNTENQRELKNVSIKELETLLTEGHFKKGSMLPKVEACMSFVKRTGKKAVIAHLDHAEDALYGKSGTIIHP